MSKLGNKPILIPKETTVKVEGERLILSGPKGKIELNINNIFEIGKHEGLN